MPSEAALVIGTTVGNYRIDALLGAGGMGAVYLAEHLLIGRKTAVKVLLPQLSHNPELVSRFFNEARSTATIQHPGLVDVFDFGYMPDGSAYLVMEYLEGESLARRLEREDILLLPVLWSVGRQIASAVHAAHEKGIVHRDLKPDNVFLVPDPEQPQGIRVKVLDFGIAKLTGEDASTTSAMTRTGAVMGTPTYMSPEQCRGAGQVDRRADVYSLGCILYEMACGQPPFVKEGVGELIAAHIYETPELPSALEPSISPTLESLILGTLAKDPAARPQTMERVRDGLDRLVTGIPVPVTPAHGSPAPTGAGTTGSVTPLAGEVPIPSPRRVGLTVGLLVGGLVALGVVALVVLQPFGTGSKTPHSPGTTPALGNAMAREAPTRPIPAARVAPMDRPAAPRKVRLSVVTKPPGAEVYRAADGLLLGQTPFHHEAAPAAGRAVFLVKRPGYRDERVELAAHRSGEARLTLLRLSGGSRRAAPPPPRERVVPRGRAVPRPPPERRPAMRPVRDGVADPFAGG